MTSARSFRSPIRLALAVAMAAVALLGSRIAGADVTVSIDQASGSIVASAPGLPDGVDYPEEVVTTFTGTAAFDSGDNGVQVILAQPQPVGRVNPLDPTNAVEDLTAPQPDAVVFTGQADATCDATFHCTWSFTIPFIITPGDYKVTVVAAELNQTDPDQPGPSASQTIEVTIV